MVEGLANLISVQTGHGLRLGTKEYGLCKLEKATVNRRRMVKGGGKGGKKGGGGGKSGEKPLC